MRARHELVAALAVTALAAAAATRTRAQEQERGATRDPCTARGRVVAAFAAREHAWTVRDPSATRRLALGRGSVWVVDENHACCPRVVRRPGSTEITLTGCSVRSETRQEHVGEVGARRFALTRARPERVGAAVAGENMIRAPWRASAWSGFVRAARAAPGDEVQALALATHVHASFWHGLGIVRDERTVGASVPARRRDAIAHVIAQAHRLGLGPVESRVVRARAGFEVTLWSSRHAPSTSELDPGPGAGASSTDELRRTRLDIARDGTISVVEQIAVVSDVQRVVAR